jgi:LPS-assembly protein
LIFDVDKFSGWDRMETGTRANVGLQYTFQASGGGYARFIAGQSFHLAGTNPYTDPGKSPFETVDSDGNRIYYPNATSFSSNSGLGTDRSDYVLGAYLAPIETFRFVAQTRLDEEDLSLQRQSLYGQTTLGPVSLQAQYNYVRDDASIATFGSQQEGLASIGLKLTDRWSILGLARYDIDADLWLQEQIALKYADECFVLTASYTQTEINNPLLDIRPDQTVMLRFELKHLGQFSYKTDTLDYNFSENATSR